MKKLSGLLISVLLVGAHVIAVPAHSASENNFVNVDILQWQVSEGGADNWAQVIPQAGPSVPARIINAPFDWNTGLRIGIGHLFDPVGDITVTYTTYHTLATNQAAGIVASSFNGNYFAGNTNGASLGPAYQSASIRWQFYYNTLDLDLGHRFALDPWLQIHPYVGFKSASIKQRIFSNWYNPVVATTFTAATENLTNDFWGIGPAIGIDTTWPIFPGTHQSVSVIGNFVGALLYGHWRFDDTYANNTPVNINVYVNSVNGTAPMVGGILGLQWANQFAHSNLSVSLGYEVQAWFNQIQFYSLNGGRFNRTTYIRGGDVEFRYKF